MTRKMNLFKKANGIERLDKTEWTTRDSNKWIFDPCYNYCADWLEKAEFVKNHPLIGNVIYPKREMKLEELTDILNLCATCSVMMYNTLRIDPNLVLIDWTEEIKQEARKEQQEFYGWKFD